ncbi:MAG TPA: DUF222 domain-containing protein [Nocardioides sp.]|uniref:HNH endonuclease signature motif containing protein n=1 Tax=Nocardioides sp. TaxID=35761 RepID=UPI002C67EB6B|nr:DUF222 domain-containing protein [Nocardioides sp.]HQR28143.1 DUF222 domain-containing protein [Nocardioides sp.]
MTALLDLHPDAAHPAYSGLAQIHEVLDGLGDVAALRTGDYADLVRQTERAIRRLQAVKLRLLRGADNADVAAGSGLPGTGQWLARETHATGASAAGQVALASALDDLPQTRTALAAGEVSPEHAAVIATTTRRLPAGLAPEQVTAVEERLVGQAKTLDPSALRKKARRALEAAASKVETDRHHDQLLREEEAAARARTRLTLHDNADGTVTGHFTVPTLAGAILRKTLQQMASPRRGRLGASKAHTGPVGDGLDWAHRYGRAFVELLEHLPTSHLHGKTAATVVVTVDHDQLRDDLRAARLDTGDEISAAEARRLACAAGILPAILNGASQPLDLGRAQRFFTEAQRVALGTRHTTCAADGCDRPYAWCELHHRQPWSHGGTTNLADAEPLCGFHHQRIHDPAYHHTRAPDGSVTFHRRR